MSHVWSCCLIDADELVVYYPTSGTLSTYTLRSLSPSSFEFVPLSASIPLLDGVLASSKAYGLMSTNQEMFVGKMFDCTCGKESANSQQRCAGQFKNPRWKVTIPSENLPGEPIIPSEPPNLNAQPKRVYQLDSSTPVNTYPTDDLLFVDNTRGVLQAFASCLDALSSPRTPTLTRLIGTAANFVRSTMGERAALATVSGTSDAVDVVLLVPGNLPRAYTVEWNPATGGSFRRLSHNWGDFGKFIVRQKTPMTQIEWMRLHKPRVVQPTNENGVQSSPSSSNLIVNNAANPSMNASGPGLVRFNSPSPFSTSALRLDVCVWSPATGLLHYFVATYLTHTPKIRLGPGSADSDTSSTVVHYVDDAPVTSAPPSTLPSPWIGQRSYVFSFAERPIDLDSDPDRDGIITRYELGGLDPSNTGLSLEPLHAYGSSPFRKDVYVEVDWMEDGEKSMKPRDGFDHPAKADLRDHGIELHVFVDKPMARVENLGGTSFNWLTDFMPLKIHHFTPSRIGLFHYCIFLDRFNGGSVSGQSQGGQSYHTSISSMDSCGMLWPWSALTIACDHWQLTDRLGLPFIFLLFFPLFRFASLMLWLLSSGFLLFRLSWWLVGRSWYAHSSTGHILA